MSETFFEKRNPFQLFMLPGQNHLSFRRLMTFELQKLLQTARRDGMFRPKSVPVGAYLGKRDRQFRLNLSSRKKESPTPDRRPKQNHGENRHENAKDEKESGLDHGFKRARAVSDRNSGPESKAACACENCHLQSPMTTLEQALNGLIIERIPKGVNRLSVIFRAVSGMRAGAPI